MNVQAGLPPASVLYLWVTDKFGNQWSDQITVAGDGSFDIDTANYPAGTFNPDAGFFNIFVSSDADGENVVPMTFESAPFNCLLVEVACCQGIGCMIVQTDFIVT